MPSFDTPEPITAVIDLQLGDIRIIASDRTDTVVDVRPSDASRDLDIQAAEQTRVTCAAGQLLVKAPRQRGLGMFGRPGSVDVTVELPAGSALRGEAGLGAFHCAGRLGDCRVKTGLGDIEAAGTGPLDLHTGSGTIVVDRVAGLADVTTGSGRVRLGAIDGPATVKNSNGDTWIGEVTGDLRVSSSNGTITVGHASGGVTASSANGDLRVGEVARGSSSLRTSMGSIEVGIRPGTAALLDVSTKFGRVHNDLAATEGPGPADQTAEIHASTSYGDIYIRRA
ncbi:MAG: DUF4097 family beta strand repeat-containing protein [Gemmatimonadota bacterium]